MTFFKGAVEALRTISYVFKGVEVLESGFDIYKVASDDDMKRIHKVHRIASDSLFIVLQSLDIGTNLSNASFEARFASRSGAGGADVLKITSRKISQNKPIGSKDILDIFVIACFRAVDIADLSTLEKPEIFSGHADKVEFLSAIIGSTGLLIQRRERIQNAPKTIIKLGERILSRFRNNQRVVVSVPGNNGDDNGNDNGDEPDPLKIGNNFLNIFREVIDADNIEDFEVIPYLFEQDNLLKQFVCPITNRPIRHLRVIKSTRDFPEPTYYEHAKIEEWAQTHPGEPPPKWPQGEPFALDQVEEMPALQHMINARLIKLHEQARDEIDVAALLGGQMDNN